MQMLNLELLRSRTPPGTAKFRVKVPAGRGATFMLAYQQKKHQPPAIVTHEVKKGETLISIARRYGQEVRALMELNGLTSHRLQIGQKLKIVLDELRGRMR
jgi:LysM repeat protein